MHLTESHIGRIFCFGCSFTNYHWLTWPDILASETEKPTYNFGRSGAGNQFIFNTICQADAKYNFNENDIVFIAWTNVCREDRWLENQGWITPGNIFTQDTYSKEWVERWADPLGFLLRDISLIHSVTSYLTYKKVRFVNMQMCQIIEQADQQSFFKKIKQNSEYNNIIETYKKTISTLYPSFMEVLWNNDLYNNKILKQEGKYGKFSDGHPSPQEHMQYLETVLDFRLSDNTCDRILKCENNLQNTMKELSKEYDRDFYVYELSADMHKKLSKNCKIGLEIYPQFI